jgi:hypothetical protein
MAKRFMYVCIGLLALAAAFQIGARSASAQLSGTITAAGFSYCGGNCAFAIVNRHIYGTMNPITTDPVPGTDPVIAVGAGAQGGAQIMLANGDVYFTEQGFHTWTFLENVLGGATPAHATSWGQLKTTYR